MSDLSLLIDLHQANERQGPGSPAVTQRALELTELDPDLPLEIADIGCGTGQQTITLARHTQGQITAVDLFPELLKKLDKQAGALGLDDRIITKAGSMEKLDFSAESLDLIWSEGAIYIMGFKEGVQAWKSFLKPGGILAISEICWTTGARPLAIEEFWEKEYSQMDTVSSKIRVLEEYGYAPIAHFILPPDCWLEHYYQPLQQGFDAFLERQAHSEAAKAIVEEHRQEIYLFETYQNYYSYGFFIAQKR